MRSFLLLFALPLWGAMGDITAVRIIGTTCAANAGLAGACNSYVAEIDISQGGGSTPGVGGAYDLGIGANNSPASARVVFSVASPGYDSAASVVTVNRTVYGQFPLRKPYPNQATMDEGVSGGTLTVRVVLSDAIYSGDTVTVSIASGFYSQGGASSAAVSGLSVTNGSPGAYQKPASNWLVPSRRLVGSTLSVAMFGMSGTAADGLPLAAVVFTATDAHSHTATATVATMTKTTGMAVDFARYAADLDVSGFTNGDLITVNYKAYPRIGDSGAVFDTNDNAAAGESTYLAAPIFFVSDVSGTFGTSYAFVDPVAGDDTAGTGCAAYATVTSARAKPCLTIGRAERVVRDYNNTNYSRQNLANSVIYLQNGTYTAVGSVSLTYSATGDVAIWTLTRAPEASRSSVIIVTDATSTNRFLRGKYVRVTDITLTQDANRNLLHANENVAAWVDNCIINGGPIYTATLLSSAYGRIEYWQNTWNTFFAPYGYWFVGNALTSSVQLGYARTHVGNSFTSNGTSYVVTILKESTSCTDGSDGAIIYNNKFLNSRDQIIQLAATCNWTRGAVIANNLIESNYVTGSGAAVAITADGTTTTTNNFIVAHNTIYGNRSNMGYNDSGTTGTPQTNWVVRSNIFTYFANKGDTFTPGSGNRVGNWPLAFGTGTHGNFGNRGAFLQEFLGLMSASGTDATPIAPAFVNDQSAAVSGTGNGDYHLLSSSPARNRVASGRSMLPYDIDGKSRLNDGTGAAGAYEYAPSGSVRHRVIQ